MLGLPQESGGGLQLLVEQLIAKQRCAMKLGRNAAGRWSAFLSGPSRVITTPYFIYQISVVNDIDCISS